MNRAWQQQEFSLLDIHFARFLLRLSGLQQEDAGLFIDLVQRLSAALDSGDSCVDLSGREREVQLVQKLPETLCIREKAYRDGSHAPLVFFRNRLFLFRYFHYEFRLAERLGPLARENRSLEKRKNVLLERLFPADSGTAGETDWQKKAAELVLDRRFVIISGGPGTGKTTTVVRILALLLDDARCRGEALPQIMLAAPTGKAAMRLGEAVSGSIGQLAVSEEITAAIPRRAVTLHRLLGVRWNSSRFRHDRENPLHCSVVIVDEASMVDLALMSKLVDALPSSGRLILLGDKDQLASVESGAVLAELLKGLPACGVQLEKSYRFDKNIKELSLAVRRGEVESAWQLVEQSARENIAFLPGDWFTFLTEGFSPYMEAVQEVMAGAVYEGERIRALFDALRSFQVLCTTRKGRRGVDQMNSGLVRFFMGKGTYSSGSDGWFSGRPVIITSNDYNRGLFNGDIGICLPASTGERGVWFEHHKRGLISVPYGCLPGHETAFAITIHKSQGSEFGEVAVLLPEHVHRGLGRELIYTGITRARNKVWLLAEYDVFAASLRHSVSRQSGLRELLKSSFDETGLSGPQPV